MSTIGMSFCEKDLYAGDCRAAQNETIIRVTPQLLSLRQSAARITEVSPTRTRACSCYQDVGQDEIQSSPLDQIELAIDYLECFTIFAGQNRGMCERVKKRSHDHRVLDAVDKWE
jgi:hypothetical protein